MQRPTVFVVSGDAAVRDSVKTLVESAGLKAETITSLQAFVDVVEPGRRCCLVFDARAGDLDDSQGQARLVAACARMPALLITDRGDVRTAVSALKAGATDVVQKPYKNHSLLSSIKTTLKAREAAHG